MAFRLKPTPSSRNKIPGSRAWRFAKRCGMGMAFLCITAFAGCGSSDFNVDRLPVAPVEGQVKLDGKPLAGALVVLHPKSGVDSKAIPARAQTDEEGKFHVTTYDANDGAPLGEHAVTIVYHPLVKNGESFEPGANVLPPKYSKAETTDLTLRVSEGTNTIPAFELKRR